MDKREIIKNLQETDTVKIEELFKTADKIRKQYVGDEIFLRGIIEFSNYCKMDCLYCGLRKSNTNVTRYRMDKNEIIETAKNAVKLNITTVVLQSGEDNFYTIDDLCEIVFEIKKLNLAVTLSLGEKTYSDYKKLKEAGTDRYLLRFETSDKDLYKKLRPSREFCQRLECLRFLKELNYQVGSGVMIGLPNQTLESIADDIILFKKLELDMIGMGPFLPHPNTPLADNKSINLEMVLKVLALMRIVTKDTHLPATTAVGTLDTQGRQKALKCGANIIMPNITPVKYRSYYQIYPDKICIDEDAFKCKGCVESMVLGAGRVLGKGYGHSFKKDKKI